MMSTDRLSPRQAVHEVFGSYYRLDTWSALKEIGLETPELLGMDVHTAVTGSPVRKNAQVDVEMVRAERLGMITRLPDGQYGRVRYQIEESAWWNVVDAAVQAVTTEHPEAS